MAGRAHNYHGEAVLRCWLLTGAYFGARRAHDYHGEAVNPAYLSWFERMVGRGKYYNPELAAQDAKGKSYENEMPGGPVAKA